MLKKVLLSVAVALAALFVAQPADAAFLEMRFDSAAAGVTFTDNEVWLYPSDTVEVGLYWTWQAHEYHPKSNPKATGFNLFFNDWTHIPEPGEEVWVRYPLQ